MTATLFYVWLSASVVLSVTSIVLSASIIRSKRGVR